MYGGFRLTGITRKRGGQWKVDPDITEGRAYDFAMLLMQVWPELGCSIINARTPREVASAFDLQPYFRERLAVNPLPELIFQAVRDRDFPKVRSDKQIRFIADSIAAWGNVGITRSRQICRLVRKKSERTLTTDVPADTRRPDV